MTSFMRHSDLNCKEHQTRVCSMVSDATRPALRLPLKGSVALFPGPIFEEAKESKLFFQKNRSCHGVFWRPELSSVQKVCVFTV